MRLRRRIRRPQRSTKATDFLDAARDDAGRPAGDDVTVLTASIDAAG
jgi:hypothetical protein